MTLLILSDWKRDVIGLEEQLQPVYSTILSALALCQIGLFQNKNSLSDLLECR